MGTRDRRWPPRAPPCAKLRPSLVCCASSAALEHGLASLNEAREAFGGIFARQELRKDGRQMLGCSVLAFVARDAGVGERTEHAHRRLLRDELRDFSCSLHVLSG